MDLIWITDPHLNFLSKCERKVFAARLKGDAIVISGDIAEAPTFDYIIKELEDWTGLPVYYVLGNHDYYLGKSVKEIRTDILNTNWLQGREPVELKEGVYLTGIDGWADMRYGALRFGSPIMSDHMYIKDFKGIQSDFNEVRKLRQKLADFDARMLSFRVGQVADKAKQVIMTTHIPPFPQNSLYRGHISSQETIIYFASKATGDILLQLATRYPDVEFLVLCGHSHHAATYEPRSNLKVVTGEAQYYQPTHEVLMI